MNYKVSFCIPVYNKSDITYQLVTKMLNNPNQEFQIVISDNASTDDTVERLKKIKDSRLKLVVNEANVGAKLNWYHALEQGDGDFLYFVIGRDKLNPHKIDTLIETLKMAEKKGIKLLKDGPCGKLPDETGKLVVFEQAEAVKRFLDVEHPSGLIYERNAYRKLKNRKKYYQHSQTYPENWIKRDLISKYPAAKIAANVYYGKANVNLKKIKSGYEDTQIPFYYPQKRTEHNIYILDMVEYSGLFDLSIQEYEEFFIYKYKKLLMYVAYHWASCMQNAVHAGHYSHEIRVVPKTEMIANVLKTYKTVNRHFASKISMQRKVHLFVETFKRIVAIINQV